MIISVQNSSNWNLNEKKFHYLRNEKMSKTFSNDYFSVEVISLQGKEPVMEDRFAFYPNLENHPEVSLFFVVDGQDGDECAKRIQRELAHQFSKISPEINEFNMCKAISYFNNEKSCAKISGFLFDRDVKQIAFFYVGDAKIAIYACGDNIYQSMDHDFQNFAQLERLKPYNPLIRGFPGNYLSTLKNADKFESILLDGFNLTKIIGGRCKKKQIDQFNEFLVDYRPAFGRSEVEKGDCVVLCTSGATKNHNIDDIYKTNLAKFATNDFEQNATVMKITFK